MAAYCAGLFLLAGLSAEDIKSREISVFKVLGSAGLAVLYRILSDQFSSQEIMGCLFPGALLLVLSFLTRESIGYGDGMAVIALGLWTGGWFTLAVVCTAIMLSGICGIICLVRRKKEMIPFTPLLLLGMEAVLFYA